MIGPAKVGLVSDAAAQSRNQALTLEITQFGEQPGHQTILCNAAGCDRPLFIFAEEGALYAYGIRIYTDPGQIAIALTPFAKSAFVDRGPSSPIVVDLGYENAGSVNAMLHYRISTNETGSDAIGNSLTLLEVVPAFARIKIVVHPS